MRTGDQAFIRELNKSIVLNFLRLHSPISRTQISVDTGLNKATVSSIIDELLAEELVLEVGHGHSSVGRRPVMLMFNWKAGYTIGVDFGVNYIRILCMDLSGRVIQSEETNIPEIPDVESIVPFLVKRIQHVIASTPASKLGILGVGVGVPGLVDFVNGVVLRAPNLQWHDVPLKFLLESQLHIEVFVDNEANAAALAENLLGVGTLSNNFLYVSAGIGIGTGIIVDNSLIRGSEGMAGEFGHMTIESQGLRCSCGNRGCLEMYSSEKSLIHRYQHITGEYQTITEILSQLKAGSTAAAESVNYVGRYLGIGLTNLINGLNPSLIVIGNQLAEAGDWILRPIEQTIRSRSFILPYSKVQIQLSSLGPNATAIGAGFLVLQQFFQITQTEQTLK